MRDRRSLIFFCGHAGAGKTTLARRVIRPLIEQSGRSFCLLDKDTLYGKYSSDVMRVLTGNADDRDSSVYLQNLRDPEYRGLLDTARENLRAGVNVIVVGPLSREIRAHRLHRHDLLRIDLNVSIRIVWVFLDEQEAKRRITARGNANDAWKLAHWDIYRHRLFQPRAEEYPELYLFDNTAPTEAQHAALLHHLLLTKD